MSDGENELKTEKRKRGCRNYTLAAVAGVVVVCLLMYAVAKTAPSGNVPQLAASTTEPVSDTDAPAQDATPAPTSTPNLAPAFEVFVENYEVMTDAQWEKFAAEVEGAFIDQWEGVVEQVDKGEILGGYTIFIDVGRDTALSEVAVSNAPEELALSLNKGQAIVFSGPIKSASNSFGMTIYLDGETVVILPIENGDVTR